jgi:NitT/TauT family transport system ATP-binding protein
LSQGMRQRVAIARTLAIQPQLWLLDEPFSALDAQTRISVQNEFLRLWEDTGSTVILVTHDIAEAVLLADRVIVMTARPGRIKSDQIIDIPRPRRVDLLLDDELFKEYESKIWKELRDELI